MNVYEMDGQTLKLVYEPVTDDNRAEYAPDFLMSYNRGYSELTRTRYRPVRWEAVALDQRTLRKSTLAYPCVEILKASAAMDYTQASGWIPSPPLTLIPRDADVVVVPRAPGGTVWVQYVHDYPPLQNPTPTAAPAEPDALNTPCLPDHAHLALCMLAGADYCRRRRKYPAAEALDSQYYRIASTLAACDPRLSVRPLERTVMDFRGWKRWD